MTFDKEKHEFRRDEHEAKIKELMLKEGTYLTYLRFLKRGALFKTEKMIEDLYDRYGQNLDGDLDSKFNEDNVREELGFKTKEDGKSEVQKGKEL